MKVQYVIVPEADVLYPTRCYGRGKGEGGRRVTSSTTRVGSKILTGTFPETHTGTYGLRSTISCPIVTRK